MSYQNENFIRIENRNEVIPDWVVREQKVGGGWGKAPSANASRGPWQKIKVKENNLEIIQNLFSVTKRMKYLQIPCNKQNIECRFVLCA